MLHNRLNVSVSTPQDIIAAILAFVTDAAWASPWEEDPSYTVAGNPGEMVLRTSGATPMYVYVQVDAGAGTFLHFGIAATNANWNTGSAPTVSVLNQTYGNDSGGFGLLAPGAQLDGTLHMVADNDRLVILLETYPDDVWHLMYVGNYTPLSLAADDTNPIIGVGNMYPGLLSSINREVDPGSAAMRFPNICLKTDPAGNRRQFKQMDDGAWVGGFLGSMPDKSTAMPKNDRAAAEEIFSFSQWLVNAEGARGEAFSLSGGSGTDGMVRCTDSLEPRSQVTIGVDTYLVAPLAYQPGAYDQYRMLIGPLGTAI